ncbi:MAG: ArsR/SmtB family transcription factor [Candidatus Hodarchaeota archaeon]
MNFQDQEGLQRRLASLDPNLAEIQQKQLEFLQNILIKEDLNNNIKDFVRNLKTLANENRIMILLILAFQERCICELEYLIGLSQPTTSHHVGRLEKGGYVITKKQGKWVNVELTKKGRQALDGQIDNKLPDFLNDLNGFREK